MRSPPYWSVACEISIITIATSLPFAQVYIRMSCGPTKPPEVSEIYGIGAVDYDDGNFLDQPGLGRKEVANKDDILFCVRWNNGVVVCDLERHLLRLEGVRERMQAGGVKVSKWEVFQGFQGSKLTEPTYSVDGLLKELSQAHHSTGQSSGRSNQADPSMAGSNEDRGMEGEANTAPEGKLEGKLDMLHEVMKDVAQMNKDIVEEKLRLESELKDCRRRQSSLRQTSITLEWCLNQFGKDGNIEDETTRTLRSLNESYQQASAEMKGRVDEYRRLNNTLNEELRQWSHELRNTGKVLAEHAAENSAEYQEGDANALLPPLLTREHHAPQRGSQLPFHRALAHHVTRFLHSKTLRPLVTAGNFARAVMARAFPAFTKASNGMFFPTTAMTVIGLMNVRQAAKCISVIVSRRRCHSHSLVLLASAISGVYACVTRAAEDEQGNRVNRRTVQRLRRWCDVVEAGTSPLMLLPLGSVVLRSGGCSVKRSARVIFQVIAASASALGVANECCNFSGIRFRQFERNWLVAMAGIGTLAGAQAACAEPRLSFVPLVMLATLPLCQVKAEEQELQGKNNWPLAACRLVHLLTLNAGDLSLPPDGMKPAIAPAFEAAATTVDSAATDAEAMMTTSVVRSLGWDAKNDGGTYREEHDEDPGAYRKVYERSRPGMLAWLEEARKQLREQVSRFPQP